MKTINSNLIIERESTVFRYSNETCPEVSNIYNYLTQNIDCTYLIYMYEDLNIKEKYVYSSNWVWQNLLIGEKLINNCPIFKVGFNYLEQKETGAIFSPWCDTPPTNTKEYDVCGMRNEHNIANGFGYASKGFGVRESLGFGGTPENKYFYQNFTKKKILFNRVLNSTRNAILFRNCLRKKIFSENFHVVH